MSLSPMGGFSAVQYVGDDDVTYRIKMSAGMAAAVGAADADLTMPPFGTSGGHNKVRVCYGVDATGLHKVKIPCPTIAIQEAVFVGGTLNVGGTVYSITGRRGERVSRI